MGLWWPDRCSSVTAESAHLSDEVSVESEADVGRVTPVDDGDPRPVRGHVQPLDNPLDKVQHIAPSLGVNGAGGIKHEHEVDQSAALYSAPRNATMTEQRSGYGYYNIT